MSESESIKLPALRSQSRRDQNPTLAQLNSLQGIVGPMNTYLRETPNPTKRPFRRYHLATIFHLYVQSIDSHIIHLNRAANQAEHHLAGCECQALMLPGGARSGARCHPRAVAGSAWGHERKFKVVVAMGRACGILSESRQ